MAGRFCRARALWIVAAGCSSLTVLAQLISHQLEHRTVQVAYIGAFNTFDSILVIQLTTYFILRGQAANAALQRAQADLAHVGRVTTMGELTASIAHEVNQPIAGVVTNASACLRWLAGDAPDLEKARAAATRIVRDGARAAEIISRIRQIFVKGGSHRQSVNMNQLARETIDLLGNEAARHAITIRLNLADDAPRIMADRVQLQQVVVNLVMNGIDAMKTVKGGARTRPYVATFGHRPVDRLGERYRTWSAVTANGQAFRPVLYDQAARNRHGAVDQPLDHRGPSRPAMGGAERAKGGDFSFRPARRTVSAHGAYASGFLVGQVGRGRS